MIYYAISIAYARFRESSTAEVAPQSTAQSTRRTTFVSLRCAPLLAVVATSRSSGTDPSLGRSLTCLRAGRVPECATGQTRTTGRPCGFATAPVNYGFTSGRKWRIMNAKRAGGAHREQITCREALDPGWRPQD
jgi:hypothetical protein